MKRLSFYILISTVLAACSSNEGSNPPLDDTKTIVEDEFHIYNVATEDTIKTGTALPFTREGVRNPASAKVLALEGGDVKSEAYTLKSNEGKLEKIRSQAFLIDSSINLSPDVTDYLPPREIVIFGDKISVKEPSRRHVMPSIYKDNSQFDIRYLSTDQGLPSNNVSDIIKDKEGFIWLATDRGLARYDGKFVVTYTEESGMSDDHITCLSIDSDQNLWMGTRTGGLIKYDGNYFTNYNLDSIAPGRQINDLTFDKNHDLWAVIEFGGILKFDGNVFSSYKQDQGIYVQRPTTSVAVDSENRKWVTGFGVGLYMIDDEGAHQMAGKSHPTSGYINNCFIDAKGQLILSAWGASFIIIKDDSLSVYDLSSAGNAELITHTEQDDQGGYWFCGYGGGVYYWDGQTDRVEFFGPEEGMSTHNVTKVFADDNNGIWIGTDGGGVCHLQRKSFKSLNKFSGLTNHFIYEVVEDANGDLYYATDKGLLKHDSTGVTHYTQALVGKNRKAYLQKEMRDFLIDPDGTKWLPTMNGGLSRISSTGHIRLGSNIATHNPACLARDSNGNLWIGGMNSDLVQVIGDSIIYRYAVQEGFCLHNTTDLWITNEDEIWVASAYQGVAHIVGDSITYYTTNEGLSSNVVSHISQDNAGTVWICTEEGLNYMDGEKVKTVSHPTYDFALNYQSILQDKEGRYWIPSDLGLIVLVPRIAIQEEWNVEDFTIYTFDKSNGLSNIEFLPNSIMIDSKNRLLIGSQGGLITRDLNNLKFDYSLPECYLQTIGINGEYVDYRNLNNNGGLLQIEGSTEVVVGDIVPFRNYPTTLTLPHELNHLTFEFSGTNWKDPHNQSFYYYLEGYEEDWNMSRNENIADYRNLSYGEYVFHLKSRSRDDLESKEFVYAFEILRPWWHSWWARLLYVLLIAGGVFGLIKWRTSKLKKRQRILEREIDQATKDIRKQKELVEEQKNSVVKAHQELNIKNQEVLDSINYAKRIQTAILPSEKLIRSHLPNSFIIYKPKDIVAGDFYWVEPMGDSTLFAAADCTGHGVPGAMVSVICNNALNRSVRLHKLDDPAKILDRTRDIVLEEFGQSEEGVNDGMDISLCKLTPGKNGSYQLEYAGAHNPLWVIRKDANSEEGFTLEETKANKQPIGKFHNPKPFTKHRVELNKGDSFYIFTDGFSDQFGGDKGKKFKTANFKRLLVSVQDKPIEEQGNELDRMFEAWKSDFEQLDDVCVIGVKI